MHKGRKLVLIRHSLPEIVPGVPANRWHLSDEGRQRCEQLADSLAPYTPLTCISSAEPKALQTAQLVAEKLGCPVVTRPGLHEHERSKVGLFATPAEFRTAVTSLLTNPEERVFGEETGDQARIRFSAAIDGILSEYVGGNVAVFTHGTVMTLFIAHVTGIEPVPFWRRLGLPAYVVLSLPSLDLLQAVESVI